VVEGQGEAHPPTFSPWLVFASTGYQTGSALVGLQPLGDGVAARELYFVDSRTLQSHHGGLGRVVDGAPDVPAAYNLMTVPRAMARGGALGGLELNADGIFAIYSAEIHDGERTWPAREALAPPDVAFLRGPQP
jgi:hypothetical protein